MGKRNRADSTEALLDVIRDDGERQLNFGGVLSRPVSKRRGKKAKSSKRPPPGACSAPKSRSFYRFSRRSVLGVDIALDGITAVKVSGDDSRRLLDIQSVPLESGRGADDPDIVAKLRAVLGRIYSSGCDVWVLHRAPDVDICTVRVPRSSGRDLENAVYWQLQKDRRFSDREFVLDMRAQEAVSEGAVPKVEVLTALANRQDVERLQRRIREAGYRATGITAIPAAFQNIYRTGWTPCQGGLTASLHVGATFSCITIYEGAFIRFSRTIKFGLDSMAEELAESLLLGRLPGVEPGQEMDLKTARQLLVGKLLGMPLDRSLPGREASVDAVFATIQDSLERVARQAERTLDYYSQHFHERCERLHLSGRIFGSEKVAEYISGQLALEMEVFDPLGAIDLSHVQGARTLGERMAMNEAVAVALSDQGRTLNLAHTYVARRRDRIKRYAANAVSAAAMLLALTLGGVFVWSGEAAEDLRHQAEALEERLVEGVPLDQDDLTRLAARVNAHRSVLRSAAQRYEALAVLTELQRLTPDRVRLLNLNMELIPPVAGAGAPSQGAPVRLLVLDAVVLGGERNFETDLTRYLIGLKASPLFGDVMVQKSEVRDFVPEGEVLHVILHLQLA